MFFYYIDPCVKHKATRCVPGAECRLRRWANKQCYCTEGTSGSADKMYGGKMCVKDVISQNHNVGKYIVKPCIFNI